MDVIIASQVFLGTVRKVVFEYFIEYLCSLEFSVSSRVFSLFFLVSPIHVTGFL